ncbi:MAG: hypothetical protein R3D84_09085 [Paracoccaceae bacterium]
MTPHRQKQTFLAALGCVLALATPGAAQDETCTLAGKYIQLDDTELVYALNDEAVKRDAKFDAASVFFDDGVEGSGGAGACEGGSIVGELNCALIEPMTGNGDSTGTGSAGGGGKAAPPEPRFDQAARDLAGSNARVTVPVRRYLAPGDPPRVITVPSGRPRLSSRGDIGKAGMERLQKTVNDNLARLGSAATALNPAAYQQLLDGGTGYVVNVPAKGEDDILLTAPATPGARLPSECVSLVKQEAEMARLAKAIADKTRECNTVMANIKARKRDNDKGGAIDWLAQRLGQDERLERLTKRHDACTKAAGELRKQHAELKNRALKNRKRLLRDQHEREIAAIKADPKLLAAEEKSRMANAIAERAQLEGHLAKMQDGMNAYMANIRSMDKAIADLRASDDPEKEAKIATLETERDRYESAYGSWLERMEAIRVRREKDFNRMMGENAKDGIGPASNRELRKRLVDRGLNPTEVISAKFGDGVKYAGQQAELDRETLGGATTLGQSTAELLGEVAVDYYTMSPAERLRRLRDYGPSALEGIGEGTVEGLEGLYKLGKGAIDLIPEAAGYEGFEGSTTGTLVDLGSKIADAGRRGTDGRTNNDSIFENYSDNISKLWGNADKAFNRKFEQLAGQGEKGIKEGVKTATKVGTMAVGGETAALQSLSKVNQVLRGLRGLDKAEDLAKVGDKAADLARTGDAVGDLSRGGNAASDVTRTLEAGGDAAGDLTRTLDPAGDLTRTVEPAGDAGNALSRTERMTDAGRTAGNSASDLTKTSPIDPAEAARMADAVPHDLGRARRFKQGSEARVAQEALEAAGVEPAFARVFAAKAVEGSAEAAIGAAALEKGLPPGPLLKSGKITEEGLRRGMRQYLDELGKTPDEAKAIIDRAMSRKPPEAPTPPVTPKAPEPVANLPEAAPARPAANPAPDAAPASAPKAPEAPAPSGAEAARETLETVNNALLDAPPDPLLRPAGRFSREELARRLATTAEEAAATKRLSPAEGAGLKAPTTRLDPADAAGLRSETARLSPGEAAGTTTPTARLSPAEGAGLKAPTTRLDPPAPAAAPDGPATARLQAPDQPFASGPIDPDPVFVQPNAQGGVDLTHRGRQISLKGDQRIGEGMTSAAYGSDQGINILKVGRNNPVSEGLDNLGRSAMEGRLAIPELRGRYRLGQGSRLPDGEGAAGGLLSVVERGPEPFSSIADDLARAGDIGDARKLALKEAADTMARDGYVLADLKADNFGFAPSARSNLDRALDFVPLDDGMVIKFKPEFPDMAVAAQKFLLDPGDAIRALPENLALAAMRDQMSLFDPFVDWAAMNAGRLDGPLSTLGNGGAAGVPYTPTLGLRFKGLGR